MIKKAKVESDNLNVIQGLSKTTPYGIVIPKKKKFTAKDCLRLHSNLIRSFIQGQIEDTSAKTLSYLLSNFLAAYQQVELENRITELEKRLPNGL